jgi:asparagine synthase (glutamine-hydrolysing)
LIGVKKLPAGSYILVDLNTWEIQRTVYWHMEDAAPVVGNPVELIREELETIGELIIRSDVPVGVALSSGLDSSAIAALSVNKYPGAMHAFSVGYQGIPACDERNDAKRLADHFKMPFHEIELTTEDFRKFRRLKLYARRPYCGHFGLWLLRSEQRVA